MATTPVILATDVGPILEIALPLGVVLILVLLLAIVSMVIAIVAHLRRRHHLQQAPQVKMEDFSANDKIGKQDRIT